MPIDTMMICIGLLLLAFSIYRAVKIPTRRIGYLAIVFLVASILILTIFNKSLMRYKWFFVNSDNVIIGITLIFFNLLFIGAVIADSKEKGEKVFFAKSLYSKKELRAKRYKKYFYLLFLVITWLIGISLFGGLYLIEKYFF